MISLVSDLLKNKDSWVISNILAQQAKEIPNKPALQWKSDHPITYEELYDDCLKIAGGLKDMGIKKGEKVLIMMPNSLEIIKTWLSVNLLGGIEVPINIHYKGSFLVHEVNDCAAKVAVIHEQYYGRFKEVAESLTNIEHVVIVGEKTNQDEQYWRIHQWSEIENSQNKLKKPEHMNFNEPSAIMYTSGTTGPSKGVIIPYGLSGIFAQEVIEIAELTSSDVYYVCLPLFHANAQFMQVLPALIVGARVSVWPSFSASQWLNQIRECGATMTNTLGVMCEFIYRQPKSENDSNNPLRAMITLPAPKDIAKDLERRFTMKCLEGYGMTETSVFTYRKIDEPLRLGSAGKPLDWFEVRIADPETDEELPRGKAGEILVRPKLPGTFMLGYNNVPHKTVEAWRNLWFHTGDMGKMDEEGYLYFVDRIKDAIRRRGENISSQSIEAVVNSHPKVEESAAVAVPSEYGEGGEDEVKICVVLKEGQNLNPLELHEYCEGNMPYFAVPRYIEYLSNLPKTANEKIRKIELRENNTSNMIWDREKEGIKVSK